MAASNYHRLALLAALFAIHGAALAIVPASGLFASPGLFPRFLQGVGEGWLMGLACWPAVWPTMRAGSRWRGWLEGLVILGATIVACWLAAAATSSSTQTPDTDLTAFHFWISIVIVNIAILMAVFAVAALVTRWRLEVPNDALPNGQVRLSDILLLIALVALHMAAFRGLFQAAVTWKWHEIQRWMLTAVAIHLAFLALPTILMFLAPVRLILGQQTSYLLTIAMPLMGFVIFWIVFTFAGRERTAVYTAAVCGGIAMNAAVTSLALRMMGFRMIRFDPKRSFAKIKA